MTYSCRIKCKWGDTVARTYASEGILLFRSSGVNLNRSFRGEKWGVLGLPNPEIPAARLENIERDAF